MYKLKIVLIFISGYIPFFCVGLYVVWWLKTFINIHCEAYAFLSLFALKV